ncbi:MAG: hypothetical protein Q8928_11955 [Bacteroidota bacterium]|nr:hypothetical protein [Bacteroidota bacterium]
MKWMTFILSIYILCLVSLPCADGADHTCSSQNEQTTPVSDNSCSPFCVCACCNVMVTIANYSVLPVPSEQIYSQISLYYEGLTSRFNTAIWQPPKVNA